MENIKDSFFFLQLHMYVYLQKTLDSFFWFFHVLIIFNKNFRWILRGKHSVDCFETICTCDIKGLPDGCGSLTVFTSEKGTILDDLIVTKITSDCLYVVSNAAMKKQDMEIMSNAVVKFINTL